MSKTGKKERDWKGFYTAIIMGCSVGIVIFATILFKYMILIYISA